MRAYIMARYGDASGSRLAEMPDPHAPGPGEIAVRIAPAGLNPVDFKIDEGELRVTIDRVFPFEQVAAALAYLQQGRAKGKVVVSIP